MGKQPPWQKERLRKLRIARDRAMKQLQATYPEDFHRFYLRELRKMGELPPHTSLYRNNG